MSFVIVEYDQLLRSGPVQNFYTQKMRQLEQLFIDDTNNRWNKGYGGFTPGTNQWGRTTIMPDIFADEAADVLDSAHTQTDWGVDSFRQEFTSTSPGAHAIPGWKTILQGATGAADPSGGQIPEDYRVAWAGLAFTSKTLAITKIRFTIGDTNYARVDVEELNGYNKPALIFEEGFIIPEETQFLLRGFFEATAYQRVVPLGFMAYSRKDLVI